MQRVDATLGVTHEEIIARKEDSRTNNAPSKFWNCLLDAGDLHLMIKDVSVMKSDEPCAF